MSQEVIDDGPLAVLNKLFKNEQEDADDYILVDDDTPQQEDLLPMSTQNIEASCGKVKGVLLLDLFRCPGIHSPCIMVNGGLHTPKEFVVMAGKDKQKDWKGSIRIAGETIRQMMDTKTLEFAQHETDCSGKCGKGRAMELATCLQFLNKLPAAGFPTNGFLPMMPAGATVPTPSPQLNLTHTKLDFIPSDVTQQNLQNIMVKEPMRFFTELHQMGLLSQILNNLASALESTNDEEPLPTSFSHTFAPALFCALSTFNLLPEVFEMIKQKKDFLSQSVQFETVSSTNHTLETSTSQNINAKEESL